MHKPNAGLADGYNVLGFCGFLPPKLAQAKAKEALEKALAIDDTLVEAHTALAYMRNYFEWDFDSAEREFRKAMALNPSFVPTYGWYGLLLACLGRHEEAHNFNRKAMELDPLSAHAHSVAANALLIGKQYEEAIDQLEKALEMHPDAILTAYTLGMAYSLTAQYDEAIEWFQKASRLTGHASFTVSILAMCFGLAGQHDQAQEILEELTERARKGYVSPMMFALMHFGMGETEEALAWLEKSFENRDPLLIFLRLSLFDVFSAEVRFQERLGQLQLGK